MSAKTKCSHCEEHRVCRCSYADCPFDVDSTNTEIERLSDLLATTQRELAEARASQGQAAMDAAEPTK